MPRDYKNRASTGKNKGQQKSSASWWKWLLVFLFIALFVYFLLSLKGSAPPGPENNKPDTTKIKKQPKHQDSVKKEPSYDFYTILPNAEVVIPDYEINTRSREERLGKRKASKYIVQAGSFRHFNEADKLKAVLALAGIESTIEKAIVDDATWNRVNVGPYSHSSHISAIKKRLKKEGVDAIVIEITN